MNNVLNALNQIIVGKADVTRLALTCLIARGHLLLEDLPGMGKTTLAHALAQSVGLQFQRVQFTSDLLPADILGTAIFDRRDSQFVFHPGPIFTQVLLADEVNRATPKTQSALLEAMAERQVTIEGQTRALPQPFFVIATQNPQHQIGTYPLPESQLDRFLMRLSMGYPSAQEERELLRGSDRQILLKELKPLVTPAQLQQWQNQVDHITVSEALLDYLQQLVEGTRQNSLFAHGLSPRASLAILRAARAHALLSQREFVLPDDVHAVFIPCAAHRLQMRDTRDNNAWSACQQLLKSVPVPR